MKLDFLANHEKYIPVLADWYFKEWGNLVDGSSVSSIASKLNDYLNTDKVPLIVLAIENNELLGAVQLKFREMTIYPDKEHWLGGVYVSPGHRNNGLAKQIVNQTVEVAQSCNVRTLHLQTQDLSGGLYKKLGWKPTETVNYRNVDVLVMEKDISSC